MRVSSHASGSGGLGRNKPLSLSKFGFFTFGKLFRRLSQSRVQK
jgi:hypothetical protein